MGREELLERYIDLESHNLFCYSANYGMTEPKPGCEKEWHECKERLKGLEEIRDFVKLHEIPEYIRDACIMNKIDITDKTVAEMRKELLAKSKEYNRQMHEMLKKGVLKDPFAFRLARLSASNP